MCKQWAGAGSGRGEMELLGANGDVSCTDKPHLAADLAETDQQHHSQLGSVSLSPSPFNCFMDYAAPAKGFKFETAP